MQEIIQRVERKSLRKGRRGVDGNLSPLVVLKFVG